MRKMITLTMIFVLILSAFSMFAPQVKAQPSTLIRLTTNPYGDSWADYSPDGKKIAYTAWRSDGWRRDLWSMDADGSDKVQLTDLYISGMADWSADGTKIVWAEYLYDGRNDLKIMDLETGSISTLHDQGDNLYPRWSPDGSRILFCHVTNPSMPYWDLFVIDADGTGLRQITSALPSPGSYGYTRNGWSPDGSKIVVQMDYPGRSDIFLMDAEGRNEIKLVDNGSWPEFFSDGQRILFERTEPWGIDPNTGSTFYTGNFFSINLDGTNEVQLTDMPSDVQEVSLPTLSPNGDEIAFTARIGGVANIYKIFLEKLPLTAIISIDPDTLNLKSNGEWMSCYIELPSGYDVNNINIVSVTVNGTILVATGAPVTVGDYDIDGIRDLMVKFNRSTVIDFINTLDFSTETGKFKEVTLLTTGEVSGVLFKGSDTVKIII